MSRKAEEEKGPTEVQELEADPKEAEAEAESEEEKGDQKNNRNPVNASEEEGDYKNNRNSVNASDAYEIAASAASYLYSHTSSIIPFKSSKVETGKDLDEGSNRVNDSVGIMNSEVASFMATTDSVTAVVAAKEEVKQAVANDLNSVRTSPCEWFICDDDETRTRFFVIQVEVNSWHIYLIEDLFMFYESLPSFSFIWFYS